MQLSFEDLAQRRQAIARSRYAETVVQAAYGSRGRNQWDVLRCAMASRGRAALASDGLVETLVTLLATVIFGLSWASFETRSADAALQARHEALTAAYAANTKIRNAHDRNEDRNNEVPSPAGVEVPLGRERIGVGAETGYAAVGLPNTPFLQVGAANTQWTEEPHARSRP